MATAREDGMDLLREILASHPSGISRDGLLAWARLRGDPQLTDAQLEAALAELGDEVVDQQGFLYLRPGAGSGANARGGEASGPAAAMHPLADGAQPAPLPSAGTVPGGWQPSAPVPGGEVIPGWRPPEATASEPPAAPPLGPGGPPWVALGQTPPPEAGGPWPADGAPAWTAAPSTGSRRTMAVAAVLVFGFLVAAGVGALMLRGAGASDDSAAQTPGTGSVVDANAIGAGDCIVVPSENEFAEVRRLSCADPHDGEVFLVVAHPGADFPSNEDFRAFVETRCLPAFAEYTGSGYEDQEILDIGWFTPTQRSWENGDRDVTCYLAPLNGIMTTVTYRGANP